MDETKIIYTLSIGVIVLLIIYIHNSNKTQEHFVNPIYNDIGGPDWVNNVYSTVNGYN
jgi:hypothetical protein